MKVLPSEYYRQDFIFKGVCVKGSRKGKIREIVIINYRSKHYCDPKWKFWVSLPRTGEVKESSETRHDGLTTIFIRIVLIIRKIFIN